MDDRDLVEQRCESGLREAKAPAFCSPSKLVLLRGESITPRRLPLGWPTWYSSWNKTLHYDPAQTGEGRSREEHIGQKLAELMIPERLWRKAWWREFAGRYVQMPPDALRAAVEVVGPDILALGNLIEHATYYGIAFRLAEALTNIAATLYEGSRIVQRSLSRGMVLPEGLSAFELNDMLKIARQQPPGTQYADGRFVARVWPLAETRFMVVTEVRAHAHLQLVLPFPELVPGNAAPRVEEPAIAVVAPIVVVATPPTPVEAPVAQVQAKHDAGRGSEQLAVATASHAGVVFAAPSAGQQVHLVDELEELPSLRTDTAQKDRHWVYDEHSQVPPHTVAAYVDAKGQVVDELNQVEIYVTDANAWHGRSVGLRGGCGSAMHSAQPVVDDMNQADPAIDYSADTPAPDYECDGWPGDD